MSVSFEERLKQGKVAESAIALWLMRRGHSVLPVYETMQDTGKGPQFFSATASLVAPDMLAINGDRILWIEAKHKTGFTWYRKKNVFETGIDIRHYNDYLEIAKKISFPLWVLFLHRGGCAKDSPQSPSGLFGNDIKVLEQNESHRDSRWGRSGMVYWTRECDGGPLRLIASVDEVLNSNKEHPPC